MLLCGEVVCLCVLLYLSALGHFHNIDYMDGADKFCLYVTWSKWTTVISTIIAKLIPCRSRTYPIILVMF